MEREGQSKRLEIYANILLSFISLVITRANSAVKKSSP